MNVSNVFNVIEIIFVMNKRGFFIGLIVVVVLLVVGFFCFVGEWNVGDDLDVGDENVSCVPASCCHASECVLESEAPDCSGSFCTMSCEPDTMDCGQGHCEYIDDECGVVWDE